MSSVTLGKPTLEILDISQNGVWLYWNAHEYFLSYGIFPGFKEAKVSEILNVQEESAEHLHWPDLDVDLSLAVITEPEKYPLVANGGVGVGKEVCGKLGFGEWLERFRSHEDFVPIDFESDVLRKKSTGREVDFADVKIEDEDSLGGGSSKWLKLEDFNSLICMSPTAFGILTKQIKVPCSV